jgi:hypothetical protein
MSTDQPSTSLNTEPPPAPTAFHITPVRHKEAKTTLAVNVWSNVWKLKPRVGEKDGPAFIAGVANGRADSTVSEMTALVGDFDGLTPAEYAAAEARLTASGYEHYIYATYSDRPEVRSARVIIPLEKPLPLGQGVEWKPTRRAMLESLGLFHDADPSCSNPGRIYFLPRHPEGEARERSYTAGRPIDWREFVSSEPTAQPVAARQTFATLASAEVIEQLKAELDALGPAVRGQAGDNHTIGAAVKIYHEYALGPEQGDPIFREVCASCQPPWTEERDIQRFMRSAQRRDAWPVPYGCKRVLAERPVIRVSSDEHLVNAQSAAALAKHPEIFTQGGDIRQVREQPLRLEVISLPVARHRLSESARFVSYDGRSEKDRWVRPPEHAAQFCAAPGTCPGARPIDVLSEAPCFLRDGSILAIPGYHEGERAYLGSGAPRVEVATAPTERDVRGAVALLRLLFIDFPFETLHDLAGAIALVITAVARLGYSGVTPGWDISANTRGSGKTLIADIAGNVATGRPVPHATFPTGDEPEQRKQITSTLLDAQTISVWDNATGVIGGAPIDQLLTSEVWQDRRLGQNQSVRLANRTIWVWTSNNATLGGDLPRRVVPVRLVSPVARPEDRTDFKIPDVKAWALAGRARLITAALTILRAYHVAGRPHVGLVPMGSFEGWSKLVRNAIVWAGLPDPLGRVQEFAQLSDTSSMDHERLVTALAAVTGNQFMSASEILSQAQSRCEDLRVTLTDMCPVRGGERIPTAAAVGRLLAKHRDRRTEDKRFIQSAPDAHTKALVWRVSSCPVAGVAGDAGATANRDQKNGSHL